MNPTALNFTNRRHGGRPRGREPCLYRWAKRRKKAHAANRVLSAVVTIEVAVAVALAAATAGARLVGFETYDILSGSMEPGISVGSLVYAKTGVPSESIREGDVIVFDMGAGKTVTHRVLWVDAPTRSFVTKGDANDVADPQPVAWENVRGKVVGAVPKLGGAISAFTTRKLHFAVAIAAFNGLLLAVQQLVTRAIERPMGQTIPNETERRHAWERQSGTTV